MKRSEFFEFLKRFEHQPIPATISRHVYLWVGEVDELLTSSPPGFIQRLDLHQLCKDITKTPVGNKAAQIILSDAIDNWIQKNFHTSYQQQALLISGLNLLYRYCFPLSTFIQLANENNIIIFALPEAIVSYPLTNPPPSYIQFTPHAIFEYLVSVIPEEAIVTED